MLVEQPDHKRTVQNSPSMAPGATPVPPMTPPPAQPTPWVPENTPQQPQPAEDGTTASGARTRSPEALEKVEAEMLQEEEPQISHFEEIQGPSLAPEGGPEPQPVLEEAEEGQSATSARKRDLKAAIKAGEPAAKQSVAEVLKAKMEEERGAKLKTL